MPRPGASPDEDAPPGADAPEAVPANDAPDAAEPVPGPQVDASQAAELRPSGVEATTTASAPGLAAVRVDVPTPTSAPSTASTDPTTAPRAADPAPVEETVRRPPLWHVYALAGLTGFLLWCAQLVRQEEWFVLMDMDRELGLRLFWHQGIGLAVLLGVAAATASLAVVAWYGRPGALRVSTVVLAVATTGALAVAWGGPEKAWLAVAVGVFATPVAATDRRIQEWDARDGWSRGAPARFLRSLGDRVVRHTQFLHVHHIAMAFVAVGVVARVATYWLMDVHMDGAAYSAMGQSWALHGKLIMPWGEFSTWESVPEPSHHYPPLYPIYLGVVYKAFGFGLLQTKLASIAVSLGALAVVFATGRDLYGPTVAWCATAFLAVEPQLLWSTGTNFSENLSLLWFALTMWGILKSLEREPYILVAGLAAGMAYLTRSGFGLFFIAAGVGGFLWRFLHIRWRVFTNGWYLGAIALFGACVGAWVTRNIRAFGGWPDWDAPTQVPVSALAAHVADHGGALLTLLAAGLLGGAVFYLGRPRDEPGAARLDPRLYWTLAGATVLLAAWGLAYLVQQSAVHGEPPWHTSPYAQGAQERAFEDKAAWRHALAYKGLFFVVLFLPSVAFFLPQLKASLRNIRAEEESGLWLGVVLMTLIAWVVASMFWVREQFTLFWFDNRRYLVASLLPLAWLLLRRVDWRAPASKFRVLATCLVLLVFVGTVFDGPVRTPYTDAAAALTHLEEDDRIAIHGVGKYFFYPYLPRHDVHVIGYEEGRRYDHIITTKTDVEYPGYVEVGSWSQTYSNGGQRTAYLYTHERVAAARGVAGAE